MQETHSRYCTDETELRHKRRGETLRVLIIGLVDEDIGVVLQNGLNSLQPRGIVSQPVGL